MRVTQVIDVTKKKSKVFIDDEFAFVLYKGELRIYHIKEGEEISRSDYDTIYGEVLPARAKSRCLNLLKSRDYTKAELIRKLQQSAYPEEIIGQAIAYVEEYGYINDEKYVMDYLSCYAERKSFKRIELDLMKKGIDKCIFRKALNAWEMEGNELDEEQQILKLLAKRHWDPQNVDRKEWYKTASFLAGKGFSSEKIFRLMKNYNVQ